MGARRWSIVAAFAIGCAGSAIDAPAASGKPEAAPLAVMAARPARPDDLAISLVGPRVIGPVADVHAPEVPIGIEIVNRSADAIALDDVVAITTVQRAGVPLAGCPIGERALHELPRALAPGEGAIGSALLPCGLDAGDHEIVVALALPSEGDGWGGAIEVSTRAGPIASMPLRVDPTRDPVVPGPLVAPGAPRREPVPPIDVRPPRQPRAGETLAPDMPLP